MENIYTIYKATNLINGKIYIGFTEKLLEIRKYEHEKLSNKQIFHHALKKYQKQNFEWEIIYQSTEYAYTKNVMEEHFIREYNSHYLDGYGYNMTYGGDGSKYKWTQKQIEKNLLGKNNPNYGNYWTKEQKLYMRELKQGKENINKRKSITMINSENETFIFKGLKILCKQFGFDQGAVINVLKGRRNNYKGYKFCYS